MIWRFALALCITGTMVIAQAEWQSLSGMTSRRSHAMAFDVANNQTVLFGGTDGTYRDETWVWDGVAMQQLSPLNQPSPRGHHLMAYDSVRQRVLLFGGSDGLTAPTSDLWSWDGADWSLITTATSPPPAYNGAEMIFDPVRDRLVMWFGIGATSGRIWEFDGAEWSQAPVVLPWPGFTGSDAIAFDADTGKLALFRRTSQSGMWRWDGVAWTHEVGPLFLDNIAARMVHDPVGNRLLLAAGGSSATTPSTMFSWDSNTHSWQLLGVHGPAMTQGGVVYDSGRNTVVAIGGVGPGAGDDSTVWEWANGPWQRMTFAPPSARAGHQMAFDRSGDRLFLFGGNSGSGATGDTWVRHNEEWQLLVPQSGLPFPTATSPARPRQTRLVYDEARDELLLMAGDGPSFLFYRLVVDQWQQIAVATPPSRKDPGVAYDRARSRVILFGGGDFPYLNDMWQWDGTSWTLLNPVHAPTARTNPAMTYDALRDRIVLAGGNSPAGNLGDTWEFDGTDWALVDTGAPAGLSGSQLAYDEPRQTVVAYTSPNNGNSPAETWQWHGTGWQRLAIATTPEVRLQIGMAGVANGVYAFGGLNWVVGSVRYSDSYVLQTTGLATIEAFGISGVSSAGPLQLTSAASLPWIDSVSTLRLEPLPPYSLPGLWSGLSNTQWQGLALPFDLDILGFAGSQLLVSLDGPWPMLDLGTGRAEAAVAIPATVALLGFELYLQGFLFEPLSGALTTSNALTFTIGAR